MTYDLTPKQKSVLKWLVEQVRAGTIAESFYLMFTSEGTRIRGFRGPLHPDLDKGVLNALGAAKMLIYEIHYYDPSSIIWSNQPRASRQMESGRECTLLGAAYTAVDTNFGATNQIITQPAQKDRLFVAINHGALLRLMAQRFDKKELIDLCFDLRVDHEEFEGDGKSSMALQLIEHMHRHNRLRELIAAILARRPGADWSPLFKD